MAAQRNELLERSVFNAAACTAGPPEAVYTRETVVEVCAVARHPAARLLAPPARGRP